ncbi:MAG: hypothetical protein ACM3SY_19805 [Candidatus Omnitrophota bacterium]
MRHHTNNDVLRKAGIGLIICLATLLTYKFIAWNAWKVKQSVLLHKKILRAPSAVNLAIWNNRTPVLKKGFIHNPKGDYYMIHRFDLKPYITGSDTGRITLSPTVQVAVNHQLVRHVEPLSQMTYRDRYALYLMTCDHRHFVFTPVDFPYEHLARLEASLPEIFSLHQTKKTENEKL